MPLVHVYWRTRVIPASVIPEIETALPTIVSRALSVPAEAAFPPSEVTVKAVPMEQFMLGDPARPIQEPMSHDIEIVIWANHWPEREARKDELAAQVSREIQYNVPEGKTGFVWLRLAPAGFAGFTGRKTS